jgi:hypothetical protein
MKMNLIITIKKPPAQLFTVVWVPGFVPALAVNLETIKAALTAGGRIIDANMSKICANQTANCLNIGEQGLPGEYVALTEQGV